MSSKIESSVNPTLIMNYLQLNVIYGKKLKGLRSDEKRKTFSWSVTSLCLSL